MCCFLPQPFKYGASQQAANVAELGAARRLQEALRIAEREGARAAAAAGPVQGGEAQQGQGQGQGPEADGPGLTQVGACRTGYAGWARVGRRPCSAEGGGVVVVVREPSVRVRLRMQWQFLAADRRLPSPHVIRWDRLLCLLAYPSILLECSRPLLYTRSLPFFSLPSFLFFAQDVLLQSMAEMLGGGALGAMLAGGASGAGGAGQGAAGGNGLLDELGAADELMEWVGPVLRDHIMG